MKARLLLLAVGVMTRLCLAAPPLPGAAAATPAPRIAALSSDGKAAIPAIPIASELKSWGTVKNPHKDAVGFTTPPGFSRSQGGRGVLYKSDTGSSRKGSTWSFAWTCTGSYSNGISGIQMVHPYLGGHVIVKIRSLGPQPCVASSWQKDPMEAGGDPKFFKETEEAARVFPLKQGQKYVITGQLGPKGDYTVSVDAKIVATANFSPSVSPSPLFIFPKPIVLPDGFAGENLPMKWRAGYAALILGTVHDPEGAGHLCQDIAYRPGTQ